MSDRLRSLKKAWAIPGWLLLVWKALNQASTAQFAFTSLGRPLKSFGIFLATSQWAGWVLGFGWLTVVVMLSERQKDGGSPPGQPINQAPIPKVEILTPINNNAVGLYAVVSGTVSPPDRPVQVLVYSGNNRWYLQGDVKVYGNSWRVRCQFGNPGESGGTYGIVAIYGKEIEEKRLQYLPEKLPRSSTVTVLRTHN